MAELNSLKLWLIITKLGSSARCHRLKKRSLYIREQNTELSCHAICLIVLCPIISELFSCTLLSLIIWFHMQFGVISTWNFVKDHKLHELKLAADHAKRDPCACLTSCESAALRSFFFFFFFLSLSYIHAGLCSEECTWGNWWKP